MLHPTGMSRRSRYVPIALTLAVLAAPAAAQNLIRAGLQGDQFLLTPGGWPHPAAPAGNPMPTPLDPYTSQKIQLGKAIFWDEQVSSSNTMACGTCHIPKSGGVDPRAAGSTTNSLGQPILGSFGVVPQAVGPTGTVDYGFNAPASFQETRRITEIQVPTMIGAYMFNNQFWDMRAGPIFNDLTGAVLFPGWASLENQAVGPPTSDTEMGHQNLLWTSGFIQQKLNREAPLALVAPGTVPPSIPPAWLTLNYQRVFDMVFAADPNPMIAAPNGVTFERFAMALAEYMRTLVPDQAPIDTNTMTRQEVLGFRIFTNSQCDTCHSVSRAMTLRTATGTLGDPWDNVFSDGQAHDIFAGTPRSLGRRIKTPTLRNVGLRQRFFHDGRGRVVAGVPQNSIPDIVDFYDIDQNPASGGLGPPFELVGFLSPNLTLSERAAVIAFLSNALTDPRVASELPPFDRPTLFSETVPFGSNLTNVSTPAAAGWDPVMLAEVPPLVEKVGGPNWWKIGVGSRNGATGGVMIPAGNKAALFLGGSDAGGAPFFLLGSSHLVSLPITPQGFATAHQPVVLVPGMIGTTSFLQWIVFDPSGDVGFSESARFTPF